ncbi:MAG: glycosyl hydrolase family 28-related protein [Planctomycetota bacterium]
MANPIEPLESRRLLAGAQPGLANIEFPADAGVVNVTDPFIGAIPDDGIDDTAALQRLFDLMTPSSRIIYFPNGQYDISDEIRLEKKNFVGEAETFNPDPAYWETVTEGDRTFVRAIQSGQAATGDFPTPGAPTLRYDFEAFAGNRRLRIDYRAPDQASNSFYYRVNGGDWIIRGPAITGDDFVEQRIINTSVRLVDGINTVEIVPREVGFELDRVSLDYGANYLTDVILQGQSETGTVLKLSDNLTNDDGSPFDGGIVAWESGVEQFFRTAVRDMTLDVGSGNPQADGLKFHGNNQSTVANVTLRAAPDSGDIGLNLSHTAAIGPILVRDVTVEGFAIGIHSAWQNVARTFEDITIRNQREIGWVNETTSQIWVEGLLSENSVPAFRNEGYRFSSGPSHVVLIDSTLTGLPGAEAHRAIHTYGFMYARNVTTSGYDVSLYNANQLSWRGYRGNDGIDGDYIHEFWSDGAYPGSGGGMTRLFDDAPDTTLGLPIKESPTVPWDDLADWDGPHNHIIETSPGVFSGLPNDDIDDGPSIQAAIDSGASTVYIPNGQWTLNTDIEIRGNVHRFIGTEAGMNANFFGDPARIVIGETGPDTVVFERLANFGFVGSAPFFDHASDRTLVFNDVTGMNYRPIVDHPGDVYINDTVGNAIKFQGGQNVWARQLNIEEDTTRLDSELDARIVNDGANVWVFGFKTENEGTHVKTINGGRTEVFGNAHLNNFGNTTPQYITIDAAFSVVNNYKPYPEEGTTYGTVEETRNGVTRTGTIVGSNYVGFSNDQLWDIRKEIIVDQNHSAATYVGDWTETVGFPRGYIGENAAFATNASGNSVTYAPTLPTAGEYEVYTRWIGDWGGQNHSGHANAVTYTVTDLAGSTDITVDQDNYSDGWFSLGTYTFAEGTAPIVTLAGDDSNTRVINTDGIMLVRRSGPVATDASFNFRFDQSVAVQFDEDPTDVVDPSDVTVVALGGGSAPQPSAVRFDQRTREATFDFDTLLPNGNYVATFNGSFGTASTNFFVLAGDANRDRDVNILDFLVLRNNFNRDDNPGFDNADFNYDGQVDILDFLVLRANFNQTVPAGPAALFADGDGPLRGSGGRVADDILK